MPRDEYEQAHSSASPEGIDPYGRAVKIWAASMSPADKRFADIAVRDLTTVPVRSMRT
jgi:hypothetical protein